ncbi:MAG TPA: IPT/TIG domain-containing protein [Labilithrix sp.]|nr:IPT/TIG domain-containing protein [Labilithrix sp.]
MITSITPLEGAYGTEVTVTGDNFDAAATNLVLSGEASPLSFAMPSAGTQSKPSNVITKWSKTEIKFRYPFPAEGVIRVTSKSGQAEGGAFVPSWKPGTPLSGAFNRQPMLAVVSPAAGTTVAAFDGVTGPVIVIGKPDGSIETNAWNRGASAIPAISLYVTPSGTVDGFFSSGGTLWRLTDAAGAATTASTGIAAEYAAGGQDATGPYAWIKNGTTLQRVRPPGWTADQTITDPTPGGAPGPTIAVSADHSLFVGWGRNDTGSFPLYDHTATVITRRLRPGQGAFDAQRTAGGGADDKMIWTRLRPGPDGRVASYFCASDTGFMASATIDCQEGYIGNGTSMPSPSQASEYIVGYNSTTAAAALCDVATATLKLGPEGSTAQQVPTIFPCPSAIVAVAVDPAGAGNVLVRSGNYLYAPRPR